MRVLAPASPAIPVRLTCTMVALLASTLPVASTAAQQWRRVPFPPPRAAPAFAFDVLRSRTVLFGGNGSGNAWGNAWFADTFEFDGRSWRQVGTASVPGARADCSAAYDWSRARTIVFGGFNGGFLDDTWEHNGSNWFRVATPSAPSPRAGFGLAHDILRQRTVLFGGHNGGAALGDTWEYDGISWTPVATAAVPPPRIQHGMAYDIVRARIVLFGGSTSVGAWVPFRDTWEYDGVDWRSVATAVSPPARAGHGLAYDLQRTRTVLFGGRDTTLMLLADTWEWDGANWVPIATASAPPPRATSGIAYDFARGRTVVFGGRDDIPTVLADTWEWDGANWEAVASPSRRSAHALAHDPVRGRTVLFGGLANPSALLLADTWEFDGTAWRSFATPVAPAARWGHSLVAEGARGRVLLFGGTTGRFFAAARADTWAWDGAAWRALPATTAPPARMHHALAHDLARGRTVLFGGTSSVNTTLDDTWEFDGSAWQQILPTASPPARAQHAMIYEPARGRTLLYGGVHGPTGTSFYDTWDFDGTNWRRVATATSPHVRPGAALVSDPLRARAVLFGCSNPLSSLPGESWEYDGVDWRLLAVSGPSNRDEPKIAFDLARGRAVLFAGTLPTNAESLADTWELLPPSLPGWALYGRGCAGSAGIPSLDAQAGAVPALGTSFALQLARLPPAPGFALLAFGTDLARWHGAPLPVSLGPSGLPGCQLWIAPTATVLIGHPGTSASHALAIPAVPSLAGLVLGAQAFVFDAGASSGLGAVTNAGILRVF